MNENYAQPSLPEGAREGIVKGMYHFATEGQKETQVRLIGSGTILMEVIAAAELLQKEFGISSDIYSATSFTELARDAVQVERDNRLNAGKSAAISHVEKLLGGDKPVVAASDYIRAFPQQIAPYITADITVLGTDGFGRSANRKALRRFFEIDRQHIALAAIDSLVRDGSIDREILIKAIDTLGIDKNASAPWNV